MIGFATYGIYSVPEVEGACNVLSFHGDELLMEMMTSMHRFEIRIFFSQYPQ